MTACRADRARPSAPGSPTRLRLQQSLRSAAKPIASTRPIAVTNRAYAALPSNRIYTANTCSQPSLRSFANQLHIRGQKLEPTAPTQCCQLKGFTRQTPVTYSTYAALFFLHQNLQKVCSQLPKKTLRCIINQQQLRSQLLQATAAQQIQHSPFSSQLHPILQESTCQPNRAYAAHSLNRVKQSLRGANATFLKQFLQSFLSMQCFCCSLFCLPIS